MISNVIIEVANCNQNGCHYYCQSYNDEYTCAHLSEDGTCTNTYCKIDILASEIEDLIYELHNIENKAGIDGSNYADTK